MSSISSNSKFSLSVVQLNSTFESQTPQIIFRLATLIRLTCGLISNFIIHAKIALPILSSTPLISFTIFNDNCKNTRIYAQTVTEWGANESLYQSTELPCCLDGARDLKSIISSHRTSACRFLHHCIQLHTFLQAPGTDTGDRAGNGAQKVTETTGWGTVPNSASHEWAHWGEKLSSVHRFSLNLWPPTRGSFSRARR